LFAISEESPEEPEDTDPKKQMCLFEKEVISPIRTQQQTTVRYGLEIGTLKDSAGLSKKATGISHTGT